MPGPEFDSRRLHHCFGVPPRAPRSPSAQGASSIILGLRSAPRIRQYNYAGVFYFNPPRIEFGETSQLRVSGKRKIMSLLIPLVPSYLIRLVMNYSFEMSLISSAVSARLKIMTSSIRPFHGPQLRLLRSPMVILSLPIFISAPW